MSEGKRYRFEWRGAHVVQIKDTRSGYVAYIHGVERGVGPDPNVGFSASDGIDWHDPQLTTELAEFVKAAGPQLERGRR